MQELTIFPSDEIINKLKFTVKLLAVLFIRHFLKSYQFRAKKVEYIKRILYFDVIFEIS